MLRIVPKIFLHTIHANVTEEKMKVVAHFSYDEYGIKIFIGGGFALQTEEGPKRLSMSAKSWHGSVCMALLDSHVKILKFAMHVHAAGRKTIRAFVRRWSCGAIVFIFNVRCYFG
jgi:hypothetical protein